MRSESITRRDLVFGLAALPSGLGVAAAALAAADPEISHTALAIHQEIVFHANRQRVYHALTDGKAFDRVVQLSDAVKAGMVPAAGPSSRISRRVGGLFSLFGGYITGLQVELVRDQRIVQVWRVGSWDAGAYSIAKFVLSDDGSDTRLAFDHQGFPAGEAQSLVEGWHGNYWQPLAKALAAAEK